jgi:hypothetical protein
VTKDIHQQRVGAITGIEFAPISIMACKDSVGRGVRLDQSFTPFRIVQDSLVGSRVKISMPSPFVRKIENRRTCTNR